MNMFLSMTLYMAIGGVFLGGLHAVDHERKNDVAMQAFVVAAWPALLTSTIVTTADKGQPET